MKELVQLRADGRMERLADRQKINLPYFAEYEHWTTQSSEMSYLIRPDPTDLELRINEILFYTLQNDILNINDVWLAYLCLVIIRSLLQSSYSFGLTLKCSVWIDLHESFFYRPIETTSRWIITGTDFVRIRRRVNSTVIADLPRTTIEDYDLSIMRLANHLLGKLT